MNVEWTETEREAVLDALDVHEIVWIDHEVGYDCGCNEQGDLPGMPLQVDALRHVRQVVLDAMAPFVAARAAQAAAKAAERRTWHVIHKPTAKALCGQPNDGTKPAEGEPCNGCATAMYDIFGEVLDELECERARVSRVEALAERLAQIHNRLHGDVEINRQEHRRGERDQIRRVHDDLRAALEGDR